MAWKYGWILLILGGFLLKGTTGAVTPISSQRDSASVWLDKMDLKYYQQGWEKPLADKSVNGNSIRMGGEEYSRGIGSHAEAYWKINLKGGVTRFEAVVGVDDEVENKGSVVFEVWADRKLKLQSPLLKGGQKPYPIAVDLKGTKELLLVIRDGGDGDSYDHADWGNARFILESNSVSQPVGIPYNLIPVPSIHRNIPDGPEIHSPMIIGGTPGRDFLYRIPVSGKRPMSFSADNLPRGLSLDTEKGFLKGPLFEKGITPILIRVKNKYGQVQKGLTIKAGPDAICLTPPMGWNSWNVWGMSVNDEKIKQTADAMVKSGLADFGYQYINIDDGWQGTRTPEGIITPNLKFPDMKALGDYLHGKGLKFGIYSSPGPETCGGLAGSYGYEYQDASTYTFWGVDYLKHDWCSYNRIARDNSLDELQKPYLLMKKALENSNRDVVYSLCQYGMGDVWKWGPDVGANLWRTTGDIGDSWSSVQDIFLRQKDLEAYAGPGHWNDPDMMVLGKVGWGPSVRPTKLNPHEQMGHMTLWAMLSAPLLLGCDLSQLDNFTLDLLTHEEVLEINQDYPGQQAQLVSQSQELQVLVKHLSNGKTAISLINASPLENKADILWNKLGLEGPQKVRNVWQRKKLGVMKKGYSTTLAPHGCVLLVVEAAGDN